MRRRLEQDDVDGITQLTSHLGKVWMTAVFALTYASSDWLTPFWREAFLKMKDHPLLKGLDYNTLTVGTPRYNWLHIGVGVIAGVAVGAVTGGIGLGVVGAAVGGGLGGVGGGATVAAVKHLSPCKLHKKEK